MGLFSIFCGAVYNDYTSMGTEMFGKGCYTTQTDDLSDETSKTIEPVKDQLGYYYAETKDEECVYKFGMDPIWFRSTNEIAVLNSFKMKISVIFGVA